MLFSVIIPTYNRADLLADTIRSFLVQAYQDFELIIVDDGGTDNTKEMVESFSSDLVHYYYVKNGERGAARNFGASKANGRFLNFFDSDDIALPNHLSAAADMIVQFPACAAFQLHVANRTGGITTPIVAPSCDFINREILNGRYCFPNGMFIERETFKLFLYNESRDLAGTEDWELYLRMIPEVDIRFNSIVTSVYVQHEGRSVLQFDEVKLEGRLQELMKGIMNSHSFMNKYSGNVDFIKSRMLSYIALHAILDNRRKPAIKYLKQACKTRFIEIFTRRSIVTIKKILFG